MYAVVNVAGKQHRVEAGKYILVDQPETQDVSMRVLMVVDGDTVLHGEAAAATKVTFSTEGIVRIRGNRSMRFKPKQGRSSKKTLGYRRSLLKVRIDSLAL